VLNVHPGDGIRIKKSSTLISHICTRTHLNILARIIREERTSTLLISPLSQHGDNTAAIPVSDVSRNACTTIVVRRYVNAGE